MLIAEKEEENKKPRIEAPMPKMQLTKKETRRLAEAALTAKHRRQKANEEAKAKLDEKGLRRIEKSVPARFRTELRQIINRMVGCIEAGRTPELRYTEAPSPEPPLKLLFSDEIQPKTAPAAISRSLGYDGRRVRKNAGSGDEQQAEEMVRTTFQVPITHANKVSKMIDRIVWLMREGYQVTLDQLPPQTDGFSPDLVSRKGIEGMDVRQILDELSEKRGSQNESSTLFDDIQAAARLGFGTSPRAG
ncbi:MAG: hypothetical protein CFE32_15750 [Alphaproteobacteria bacterium PA3]|nr:MAG: hypothetical protein CFE32_15750 [Alphaproteobacteria bacterium PA3]